MTHLMDINKLFVYKCTMKEPAMVEISDFIERHYSYSISLKAEIPTASN